jgi:hypothetical protein
MHPSLFAYAPSELSQDAFLCWLLSWLNVPSHPLRGVAQAFVQRVLDKAAADVPWSDLRQVHVRRQFHAVDIVVVFEFSSCPKLCFVIEDKIDATLTGPDQLERNINNVRSHTTEWRPAADIDEARFQGVLIKTGYDFDLPVPPGYVKVNYEDIRGWRNDVATDARSDILEDWLEAFSRRLHKIDALVSMSGDLAAIGAGATAQTLADGRSRDNRQLES